MSIQRELTSLQCWASQPLNTIYICFHLVSILSSGFSMWTNMLLANRDSLISIYLIYRPLMSFSWLIDLARFPSTMLNNSGQPCLVPSVWGKAFNLSLLSMMLAVGLSDWWSFLYSLFSKCIYHEWVLNSFQCFYCINWCDHIIFLLCRPLINELH